MKKAKLLLSMLLLLAFGLINGQQPTKTSNANDTWQIQWDVSDEFNNSPGDTSPNWRKWIKSNNRLPNVTGWKWNNQDNVKIRNGKAELTMVHNPNNRPDGGTYFKSGILKSYNTKTYGYYEAKIKGASIGEGVCPSFWLFSNFKDNVPEGQTIYCEIDIVELQQFDWYNGHQDDIRDMDLNLHCAIKQNGKRKWRRPKPYAAAQLNKWRAPWDPTEGYHIYGCEVNEDVIIWYVDGVKVAEKPNVYWKRPMNVTLSLGLRKPFVKFYNNANHAVNPLTDPDAQAKLSGMPTTMYVEYVRYWKKTSTRAANSNMKSANQLAEENDVQVSPKLCVYPNPACGVINVCVKGSNNSEIPVQVYDIAGKKVLTAIVKGGVNKQLDVSGLTKGIYVVKINGQKQQLVID